MSRLMLPRLVMGPPADDPSLPRRCAARNRASIRRAMRAASAVPISPCDNADQTRRMARCTCARVRIDDRRRPIRSAGSCAETGGRNWPRSRRNSQGWRLNNALHASGLSRQACSVTRRRFGLGMPRGRPRGLPEWPWANRPTLSRASSSPVSSPASSRAANRKRSGPSD